MKTRTRILWAATALLATAPVVLLAGNEDATAAVPFKLWLTGYIPAPANPDPNNLTNGLSVRGNLIWPNPIGNVNDTYSAVYPYNPSSETIVMTVVGDIPGDFRAIPGQSRQLTVGTGNVENATLNIEAPPGYRVLIDGVPRTRVTYNGDWIFSYQIDPIKNQFNGMLGDMVTSASITTALDWHLSLGSLHNGTPAGDLVLADTGQASDWSPLYTPAPLAYESGSDEVYVYRENNIIRQIVADQMAVDIVALNSNSYEIRCYNPGQIQNSAAPFTFSGSPFVVYRVQQGGTATSLVLTKETRNITDLVSTFPISRSETMTIDRTSTGSSSTDFKWVRRGWYTTGQPPVTETSSQSTDQGNGLRSENITVQNYGSSTPSFALSRTYTNVPNVCELVTGETVGTTNAKTTNFSYYNDSSYVSCDMLQSAVLPGGGWVAYDYEDGSTQMQYSQKSGLVQYEYHPFGNWPNTPTHDRTQGDVTHYEYTTDEAGSQTWPSLIERTIDGTTVAKTTYAYTFDALTANGLSITETDKNDFTDSAHSLLTVERTYRTDASNTLYRGQPYSITQPDGSRDDYAYESGTWDGTTFTPGSGAASRIVRIHGSTDSTSGTSSSTWSSQTIDQVYLVEGKSTAESTIRDNRALVVRTESYRWYNSQWTLVGWKNYTYDLPGNLVQTIGSDNSNYTAAYDSMRKTSDTDTYGTATDYAYDDADRISSATREGSGSVPSVPTYYTYDASDRITRKAVGSALSEQLVTTFQYDDAGRLSAETDPGVGTVTYAYDVPSNTTTTTEPDGATLVLTTNLDGTPASKTGSGTINEYCSYSVITSGQYSGFTIQTKTVGVSGGPRWTKMTSDWLGRNYQIEHPGFNGKPDFYQTTLYDGPAAVGHKWQVNKTGSGTTIYQYNALGELWRVGLDVNQNGTLDLASDDRITETNTYLEYSALASAYFLRTDTITYPYSGSASALTTTSFENQLTNLPSGTVSATTTVDIEGVGTSETVVVDRANHSATKTQTRTGTSGSFTVQSVDGLPVSRTTYDGLTTSTSYDSLLRVSSVTDSRGNPTATSYVSGTTLPATITDAVNAQTILHYDSMARKDWQEDATGHYTRFEYNLRNQLVHQWGDAALPIEYGYDTDYGDRTSMSTFRAGSGWDGTAWPATTTGTADKTTWAYDAGTGYMASKTTALNETVSSDYCSCGKISSRTNARGIVTTYQYDPITAEPTGISYSDGTPSISYSYNRMGLVSTVADATGTRTFSYDSQKPWRLVGENLGSFYGARVFTHLYEEAGSGYTVPGRIRGYQVGTAEGSNADLEVTFGYTSAGRFQTITSSRNADATSSTFRYAYLTNSALVSGLSIDGSMFTVNRTYEPQRNLVTAVQTSWGSNVRSQFNFDYNYMRQRTSVLQSGDAFSDYGSSTHRLFSYDARGQVTADHWFLGTNAYDQTQPLPGRQYDFAYENAGNRISANHTGDPSLAENYTVNADNELVSKDSNSVAIDGTTDSANTVTINGTAAGRQGNFYSGEVLPPVTSAPNSYTATISITPPGQGTTTTTQNLIGFPSPQSFTYDTDGNRTSDMQWTYAWDAENRLVRLTTQFAAASNGVPNREIDFVYDYKGRRVGKRVIDLDTSSEVSDVHFLYDGTNLIAEIAAPNGVAGALQRSYTWGLDILHSISSAGGVAALLQIVDQATGKAYLPTYDANGNVATLLNASTGAVAASYEYSPFGEQLRELVVDSTAANQPFRFATQYYDVETKLYAYLRRYYDPKTGRWISRDPLEEKAGPNAYGFCGNDPINHFDVFGEDGYGGLLSDFLSALGSIFGFGGPSSNDWAGAAVQLSTMTVSATRDSGSGTNDGSDNGPLPAGDPTGPVSPPVGGDGGDGGGSTTGSANNNGNNACSGSTGSSETDAAGQNQQSGNTPPPAAPQGQQAGTAGTVDQTQNGTPVRTNKGGDLIPIDPTLSGPVSLSGTGDQSYVYPNLPHTVQGGTIVVNQSTFTHSRLAPGAAGMNMDVYYYNNSGTSYNWTQTVTNDTMPNPVAHTPSIDSLGGAAPGMYYPDILLAAQNPPGVSHFHDNPYDFGPGNFSAVTGPVNPSQPASSPAFLINWGMTVGSSSGGKLTVTPTPISVTNCHK